MRKAEKSISPSAQRRYKLPLLLRSAERVAAFSPECEICQGLHRQITDLGAELASTPWLGRRELKGHLSVIKGITKHLKRTHGLVEEKHHVKRYVFMGLAFGSSFVMLGMILVSFGITLLTLNITLMALVSRVIFGFTIGHFLDRRAKRLGKVL